MNKKLIAGVAGTVAGAALALGGMAPAQAGIAIWDQPGYQTYLGDFGRGTTFVGTAANDKASSLKVTSPANYAVLFQHRDYGGKASTTFYIGTDNLAGWGFDNITSSIG